MPHDLTITAATIGRPECLDAFLRSVAVHAPGVPVVIGDNDDPHYAPEVIGWCPGENVSWLGLPYDCGLPASRNALVASVDTPWVAIVDDDMIFTRHTDLRALVAVAERNGLDICAGRVMQTAGWEYRWHARFDNGGDTLTCEPGEDEGEPPHLYHLVPNFFVARTGRIQALWDERFKCAPEHIDSFLEAQRRGLSVGYWPDVSVLHSPTRCERYKDIRKPEQESYWGEFLSKWGLSEIVLPTGKSITPARPESLTNDNA